MDIDKIKKIALIEIKKAKDPASLDLVYKKYLGKKGEITLILRSLANLPVKDRKQEGKAVNKIKKLIKEHLQEKLKEVGQAKVVGQKKSWLDITGPGAKLKVGHLHPLTLVSRKAEKIFQEMGFTVAEGPEIESEWYNFDALNIPKDHPARDMWDTFWLRQNVKSKVKSQKLKVLLRTHTSPVQIRYMEKNQPPLRVIAPGRAFRHEATDASHEINFYQLEGLMADKQVSVANFKAIIEEFFKRFFNKQVAIRLRPSYFPFVEPGFEVDVSCVVCTGKGCSTCSKTGWLETTGAGMVHPNVFKAAGLNPKNWQGFAFGMGLDRLAMMQFKINDIRLFYSGDLRFLEQF